METDRKAASAHANSPNGSRTRSELVRLCISTLACAYLLAMMITRTLRDDAFCPLAFTWVCGLAGAAGALAVTVLAKRALHQRQPAFFAYRCSFLPLLVAIVPNGLDSPQFAFCVLVFALLYCLVAVVMAFQELGGVMGRPRAQAGGTALGGLAAGGVLGIAAGMLLGAYRTALPDAAEWGLMVAHATVAFVATNALFPHESTAPATETPAKQDKDANPDVADSAAEEATADKSDQSVARGAARTSEPDPFAPTADMDRAIAAIATEYDLTGREAQVLEILAQGYGLARVQELLVISENTASTHRRHIYKKLGVHSREELIDLVGRHQARTRP